MANTTMADLAHEQWRIARLNPGARVEIIGTEIVVNPPPFLPHETLVNRVLRWMMINAPSDLEAYGAGVGVFPSLADVENQPSSNFTYTQPDIVVFRSEVLGSNQLLAPDVVVLCEVISAANRRIANYEQEVCDRAEAFGMTGWAVFVDAEAEQPEEKLTIRSVGHAESPPSWLDPLGWGAIGA